MAFENFSRPICVLLCQCHACVRCDCSFFHIINISNSNHLSVGIFDVISWRLIHIITHEPQTSCNREMNEQKKIENEKTKYKLILRLCKWWMQKTSALVVVVVFVKSDRKMAIVSWSWIATRIQPLTQPFNWANAILSLRIALHPRARSLYDYFIITNLLWRFVHWFNTEQERDSWRIWPRAFVLSVQ